MATPVRERRSETSASPLWLWPAASAAGAFGAALLLEGVEPGRSGRWLTWPGGADSAVALLQTLAGSVITVTALTFTLTVVALQLASQQFSPRLLRDFTRDRVIRGVLAVLVGTLVFTVTVLSGVDSGAPLPHLALLAASGLGLLALAAVLGFITHMTRVLRVDTMMRAVHDETDKVIATFYPPHDAEGWRSPDDLDLDPAAGLTVCLPTSGFVRSVEVPGLVRAARAADAVVCVEVRAGDHVVRGTPVATVWTGNGAQTCPAPLAEALRTHIRLGYERTLEQDAAFGFRQLTDIAVKALSPGVNDPVTAAHAVGHMADLCVKLMDRRLGATLHEDPEGVGRVVVPDRDLPYYLDLVCGPIRRYGRHEPSVLVALLRMLRDAASAAREAAQRRHIADQVDLVLTAAPSLDTHDAAQVQGLAERVRQVLRGETAAAYRDRSGETRSV